MSAQILKSNRGLTYPDICSIPVASRSDTRSTGDVSSANDIAVRQDPHCAPLLHMCGGKGGAGGGYCSIESGAEGPDDLLLES